MTSPAMTTPVFRLRTLATATAVALMLAGGVQSAHALSEIPNEGSPGGVDPQQAQTPPAAPGGEATPAQDLPGVIPAPEMGDEPGEPVAPETSTPRPEATGPIPEVLYDLATLPEPVRRTRDAIIAAAKAGDLEQLRPLVKTGEDGTQLSLGGVEGDVIEFLKQQSGDGEGHEILAILEEVLDAGFVHLDIGKPEELYVWPYFFAVPIDRLTPPQRVELFKIVTAGDYEDMKSYGAYVFYRIGITPAGEWAFFIAGD